MDVKRSSTQRHVSGIVIEKMPLWTWLVMLFLVLVKLWLVEGQNLVAFGRFSHDDALFIRLADYLLHGQWLGPYSSLTLAKGPFYPMWIVLSFVSGTRLLLSQHFLYIAACLVFIVAIRPVADRSVILVAAFAVLLFNPLSYHHSITTRVLREGIYPAWSLLVVSFAIGLLVRQDKGWRHLWAWSCGLGLSFSAFWLTREEGLWLLPFLGLLCAFAVFRLSRSRPLEWKQFAEWGLPIAIWIVSIGLVSGINWYHYGLFAKTEVDSQVFKSAYGSLTRVKSETWHPLVPVTKRARMRIYRVSPAFAELKPYFEGDFGEGWAANGPNIKGIRNEIKGGWFVWAFRDAVNSVGYYSGGKFPSEYYLRLTAEIEKACESGRLDCFPARSSLAPPWQKEYLLPLLRKFLEGWLYLIKPQRFYASAGNTSSGPDETLAMFRDLTREKLENDPMLPPSLLLHQTQFEEAKVQILDSLGELYRAILPYLTIPAFLGYLYLGINLFKTRRDALKWVILTSLLLSVATRVVILAMIDITSFSTINALYMPPTFLLFLAFVVLSWMWSLENLRQDWGAIQNGARVIKK